MRTKIVGLEKAMANFSKRQRANITTDIVNGGAAIVQSHVIDVTPEITGDLRRGNKIKPASGIGTTATAIMFNDVEYAPHVEFGTVNMASQSFMHRGAQSARPKVKQYAKDQVKKAMKV